MRELSADVIVVGGGTGGFAAALAAARMGKKAIVTEETDWIGGQLTSQAVPPDEHPWIEEFGCTRTYRRRGRGREYPVHGDVPPMSSVDYGLPRAIRAGRLGLIGLFVPRDPRAPTSRAGRPMCTRPSDGRWLP